MINDAKYPDLKARLKDINQKLLGIAGIWSMGMET